jgi:large subunit ribosomal protein L20
MPRVKRAKIHVKKRRNLLKRVKGYRWGRKNLIKQAKVAARKAGVYAYRDRRKKKTEFRQLWQIRINAACRQLETTYSKFIYQLKKSNIQLDRKILAELAEKHFDIFKQLTDFVKK